MQKIAVGIVSAVVGGAMLVTGVGTASASTATSTAVSTATATSSASYLRIRDISPSPVVVKVGSERKAYFNLGATRDIKRVVFSVAPVSRTHTMTAKSVKDLRGWRYSVEFNDHDPAGKWKATAVAYNRYGRVVARDNAYFSLVIKKTDTRVSFNAGPSKIRKGKNVYFSGKLQAKDRRWEGVRGQKVNIYYRQSGSRVWKWVASDYTSRGGKFFTKARAYKSGTYKAVYSGNRKLDNDTSRYDYVRVYGR